MKSLYHNLIHIATAVIIGVILSTLIQQCSTIKELENQVDSSPIMTEKIIKDTIYIDHPVVQWKTKSVHDTTTTEIIVNDTVYIVSLVEPSVDSFETKVPYDDSSLNGTLTIQGRGVHEKTFIDSVQLEYTYKKTEITKYCPWWRRLFGCCR